MLPIKETDLDICAINALINNKIIDSIRSTKFTLDIVESWLYSLLLAEKLIRTRLKQITDTEEQLSDLHATIAYCV